MIYWIISNKQQLGEFYSILAHLNTDSNKSVDKWEPRRYIIMFTLWCSIGAMLQMFQKKAIHNKLYKINITVYFWKHQQWYLLHYTTTSRFTGCMFNDGIWNTWPLTFESWVIKILVYIWTCWDYSVDLWDLGFK